MIYKLTYHEELKNLTTKDIKGVTGAPPTLHEEQLGKPEVERIIDLDVKGRVKYFPQYINEANIKKIYPTCFNIGFTWNIYESIELVNKVNGMDKICFVKKIEPI